MAVFARFGSDVDSSTAKMLKKGQILTELFKQKKSDPLSVFDETAILSAYKNDVFTDMDIKDIKAFTEKMLKYLKKNNSILFSSVNSSGSFSEDDEAELKKSILKFKGDYHE